MWLFWQAEVFWDDRVFHAVFSDNVLGRRQSMIDKKEGHEERENLKTENFFDVNEACLINSDSLVVRKRHTDSGHLRFWCHESAWTYCCNCNSVSREKLLQKYVTCLLISADDMGRSLSRNG